MYRDIYAKYIKGIKDLPTKGTAAQDQRGHSLAGSTRFVYPHIKYEEIDLAVINGNIVLPDIGIVKANLYINNGKILSLGLEKTFKAREIIDASHKYVIPGIIDPHVHLGFFASLEKELQTETKAALIGGITSIGCYFNIPGSYLSSFPALKDTINNHTHVDIIPHLVISSDEQKREIPQYITQLGIQSLKVYMNGIPGLISDVDDGFILDVFEEIKKSNKPCIVCSHSENRYLVRRAYEKIKEEKGNEANIIDWAETHPDMAEEEAVIRLSFLAEKMSVPVYFVHISSAAAINRLRTIKKSNKYINIETTSPYLSLTKYSSIENSLKMEPPLRDVKDMEELWKAVEDGTVDTIGTDNVTMTKAEKKTDMPIWEVIPGYPALETHLTVLLHEGVVKRGVALEKVIAKITKKPAEIFNIYPQKGTLLQGSDADIVIVDLEMAKEVKASQLHTSLSNLLRKRLECQLCE